MGNSSSILTGRLGMMAKLIPLGGFLGEKLGNQQKQVPAGPEEDWKP